MLRREDRRFLTGQGRYLDDMVFPGALHVQFVRSPHAHARFLGSGRIRPRDAGCRCGGNGAGPRPMDQSPPPGAAVEGLQPVTMETFPVDKVRFNGDLVACVVAETHRKLKTPRSKCLWTTRRCRPWSVPPMPCTPMRHGRWRPDQQPRLPSGVFRRRPERHFAGAHRVVEARFAQHRQTHAPLEPRGCCAIWDQGRAAPDDAHRQPGAPSLSHAPRRSARPVRDSGDGHLSRHRRRVRPEDRPVPRRTDRRRPVPRAQPAGAVARNRGENLLGLQPCPRADRPDTRGGRHRRAHHRTGDCHAWRISAPTASIPPTTWPASWR